MHGQFWTQCDLLFRFVKADDQSFDKFRCPLFKGFVVTVSGLESNERGKIKDIVTKEGGRYSGEMKINECTHLVVNVPRGKFLKNNLFPNNSF
jgi:topoisomerase (DNA) II binding protein 1